MVEILKTLRDTPLPSILVIGGLVFLLLPFLKKTGGAVEIETSNKGLAAVIGTILLAAGVGLYLLPPSSSNSILEVPGSTAPATLSAATQLNTASTPTTVIVSLKYDETGGVHFTRGQTQFVAVYLRQVQGGGSLEEAIQSIKQQAVNAHATTQEGKSITIQLGQAYLVWCPTADCIYPTNTSFPLQGFRQDYLKVAVVEVGESRLVQCPSNNCWAVAIR